MDLGLLGGGGGGRDADGFLTVFFSAFFREWRTEALDAIGFTWQVIEAKWEENFGKLLAWRARTGNCNVPISEAELGSWVSKQRQSFKVGKLSADKAARLGGVGFTWSTADAVWDRKLGELARWMEGGNDWVPFNEGDLGWWSNTQRQVRRKGKMSAERERRLDGIGFVWAPSARCEGRVRKRKKKVGAGAGDGAFVFPGGDACYCPLGAGAQEEACGAEHGFGASSTDILSLMTDGGGRSVSEETVCDEEEAYEDARYWTRDELFGDERRDDVYDGLLVAACAV